VDANAITSALGFDIAPNSREEQCVFSGSNSFEPDDYHTAADYDVEFPVSARRIRLAGLTLLCGDGGVNSGNCVNDD